MIKFLVLIVLIALAGAFLFEPIMQAGRSVRKRFKEYWEDTDENTDL